MFCIFELVDFLNFKIYWQKDLVFSNSRYFIKDNSNKFNYWFTLLVCTNHKLFIGEAPTSICDFVCPSICVSVCLFQVLFACSYLRDSPISKPFVRLICIPYIISYYFLFYDSRCVSVLPSQHLIFSMQVILLHHALF